MGSRWGYVLVGRGRERRGRWKQLPVLPVLRGGATRVLLHVLRRQRKRQTGRVCLLHQALGWGFLLLPRLCLLRTRQTNGSALPLLLRCSHGCSAPRPPEPSTRPASHALSSPKPNPNRQPLRLSSPTRRSSDHTGKMITKVFGLGRKLSDHQTIESSSNAHCRMIVPLTPLPKLLPAATPRNPQATPRSAQATPRSPKARDHGGRFV